MLLSLARQRLNNLLRERKPPPPPRQLLAPQLYTRLEELDQLHWRLLLPDDTHSPVLEQMAYLEPPPNPPLRHRQRSNPPPHVVRKEPQV